MLTMSFNWMRFSLAITVAFGMVFHAVETRGSTLKTKDLAQAGLSIIASGDPAFASELQQIGLATNPDVATVSSSAVILKNTSKRSVVAFGVNWTIVDERGITRTRGFNYIQPSGLLDGGKAKRERAQVEHQIKPGESRLLTVNGMARTQEELHDLARAEFTGTISSVELDLAIFDDGEAVGPNQLGLMERFTAYVNAEQDLMQEVEMRISKGEELGQVLANIRGRLTPDSGGIPTT
ncbi:MAG: hypothetical protein WA738_13340, partial [Candidatus Angelobacter sp.]